MRYVLLIVILLTSFFIGGCGDCFVGCGDTSVNGQSSVSTSREDNLNLYIAEQSDKLIEHYKDSDTFSHTYSSVDLSVGDFLPKTIEYMDSRGYRVDTIKQDNNTALYFVSKSMYFYSNINKGVTVVYREK